MKRIALLAGAFTAVISLITAGTAVASRSSGTDEHQVRTFAVVEGHAAQLDVGPSGSSPGDTSFFQNELSDVGVTKHLGRYDASCVLEDPGTSLNLCTATAFLGDGKVELAARVRFTDTLESFRLAVIGGTGRYDNVVGQATFAFGCAACPPGTEADTLTLDLIPSFEEP